MKMKNPYLPKPVRIISFKRESSDTFTLRLGLRVKHEPGQFLQVSIPGIGEVPISFASYSDKHVELSIHKVGNVTNALGKLKKGDKLLVRGPYGKGYPMEELKGKSLVIMGGGCGVAPLKGVIEYVEEFKKDFDDVILFLGFRSVDDILFKENLSNWKKKFCVNTSVDKKPAKTCFDVKVGFITKLIEKSRLESDNSVALMCGPPIMINFIIKILKDKGFKDNQVFVSAERMMNCGIGVCGHCMIHGKYTCKDGPVFRYDEIKND
tara:strand:- start:15 stop:809 length:795 start_codon:yes stop_codon:yes gene_type:complete